MKWYETKGHSSDIAVSSRVRMARNLQNFPFPGRMNDAQELSLVNEVSAFLSSSAGGNEFRFIDLEKGAAENIFETGALVERHLISPELASKTGRRGVVLSGDDSISVMINEEDHLRIQALGSGLCLDKCLVSADRIDDLIESRFKYAWSEHLGYLTHCPTNLGTGLRASVMLHLPAHGETGEIRMLVPNLGKLGFAVRGAYGEGTKAAGAFYQISNQMTLGISEQETLERLEQAVQSTIERERELRKLIAERNPGYLEDKVWRAYGLLRYAMRISAEEATDLIGDLRMGTAMGIPGGIDIAALNRLSGDILPNRLCASQCRSLSGIERDELRAKIIKNFLNDEK